MLFMRIELIVELFATVHKEKSLKTDFFQYRGNKVNEQHDKYIQ